MKTLGWAICAACALLLPLSLAAGDGEKERNRVVAVEALPEPVKKFVADHFKGCRVIKAEQRAKVNLVLATVMWDLYRPTDQFDLVLRDAKDNQFKAEITPEGIILKVDDFRIRFADLPLLVAARANEKGGVVWDEWVKAERRKPDAIVYKLKGKQSGTRVVVDVLHTGETLP